MKSKSAALLVICITLITASASLPTVGKASVKSPSNPNDLIIGNDTSWYASMSDHGDCVAFQSKATNLTTDNNGAIDIFVRNRVTQETILASVASDGTQADGNSSFPIISADCSIVAFESVANNLGGRLDADDVYVHNLNTGITTDVCEPDGTEPISTACSSPSLSSDGNLVVFESQSRLIPEDLNSNVDIYLYNLMTGSIELISVAPDGTPGDHDSQDAKISPDGHFIVFASLAGNLVPGDTNESYDIFIRDLYTNETSRISVTSDGQQANSGSWQPSISANNRYIVFDSEATNFIPNDINGGVPDVYLHDRLTGKTDLVSKATSGAQASYGAVVSYQTAVSDTGLVTFISGSPELDENVSVVGSIFTHDYVTGITSLISKGFNGSPEDVGSLFPTISADGVIAFETGSSNIIDGIDTSDQIIVFNPQTGTYDIASVTGQNISPTYSITGHVYDGITYEPIEGATLTYNFAYSVTTDQYGQYKITGLSPGTHTVTPTYPDHHFYPAFADVTVPPDRWDVDFAAWFEPGTRYSISGIVTNQVGFILADVDIRYAAGKSVKTDANGEYTISDLAPGKYTLIPSKPGFFFTPATLTLTVDSTLQDQDFTGYTSQAEIAFRPFDDGYYIHNYGYPEESTPTPEDDFTLSDLYALYESAGLCQIKKDGKCFSLGKSAKNWYESQAIRALEAGHCEGMSVTSLRLFNDDDYQATFQPDAVTTYDLDLENVRRYIAYYQVLQEISSVKRDRVKLSPKDIYNTLSDAFAPGSSELYVLGMTRLEVNPKNGYRPSHTVVPYAITTEKQDEFKIWVYDPSHPVDSTKPGDALRFITINTSTNTWRYDDNYFGGDDDRIGVWPISIYTPELITSCAWCDNSGTSYNLSQASFANGNAVITDSSGRQLGYIGNNLISDIPGAYARSTSGDNWGGGQLTFYLPLTDTYQVSLEGVGLSQATPTAYWQFGPNYSLGVETDMTSSTANVMTIDPSSGSVEYTPNEGGPVNFILTTEAIANTSYEFEVNDLNIGAGHTVSLANDKTTKKLVLSNDSVASTYSLVLTKLTASGEQTLSHPSVAIGTGDTHYVNYGVWDGQDDVEVGIDHDGDGIIDEEIHLSSTHQIFLPMIIK